MTSLSLFTFKHWRRKWQPTPVFLPGESQDGGAWWAAVYGVAQSRTRLKRLSSSSSIWHPNETAPPSFWINENSLLVTVSAYSQKKITICRLWKEGKKYPSSYDPELTLGGISWGITLPHVFLHIYSLEIRPCYLCWFVMWLSFTQL